MSRHPALMNRVGLTVTGLLLLAIGAGALVRGLNLYPRLFGVPHTPVVDQAARAFASRNVWFWIALAAALFALAVVSVSWLVAQSRRGTARAVRLDHGAREGVTTLSARALTDAVRDDLDRSPYVRHCRARLVGSPAVPRLHLAVTIDPDADPAAARDGIREALNRLHQAVGAERLPATVYLRTGR